MLVKFLERKSFVLQSEYGPNYWVKNFLIRKDFWWKVSVSLDDHGVQYVAIGGYVRGCITLFREDIKVIFPLIRAMALLIGDNK